MGSFIEKYPELLGMGEEEIKVYKLLGEIGESPAKVISTKSAVPYSRIHAVLYKLQQEGFVISRGEMPKLFALRFKDPALPELWTKKDQGNKAGG